MAVPAAPDSGVRWNALDWAGAPFALRINALVQNTKARTLRIAVSFLAPPKTVSTSDRWFKGAYRPKVNADVPAEIVAELRSVCLALPETHEEPAWVGTRWRIRTQTFAHVLTIDAGWPPAYARAAETDGPATVLTFESSGPELAALSAARHPFFK